MLHNKNILVTGGTGSFGSKFTEYVLKEYRPKRLVIFSRDEFKQYEMSKKFPTNKYPIRYFLGDIRDKPRLIRAFHKIDYVIHAAALKQVPALEYNPMEAVKTNVNGANNVVEAALDCGVKKVVALSTDKAVNPINLYGATKLVAEKIFVAANAYGSERVKFSVVRYGNVIGSRGSVIPYLFKIKNKKDKFFPITDVRMTRFFMTLKQSVELVFDAIRESIGGEVFVPKVSSVKISDLVKAIAPLCKLKVEGIRPGEKIHETLIAEDEVRNVRELKGKYVILPQFFISKSIVKKYSKFPLVNKDFIYRSDKNNAWLSGKEIQALVKDII